MEPAYMYKLPIGTSIFRAKTIAKEGRWHTLSLTEAYTYGEIITEYSTTRELKLLNITSLTFHNDLIDRLNILYPGIDNTGLDIDKLKCLIPLGLIDNNFQTKALNILNISIPVNSTNLNEITDLMNINLMNRHRLSEHTLDTHMVSVIEKIYGDHYDGYISPVKWPSKYHNGFFPRELCIFKRDCLREEKTHLRPPHFGGSTNSNLSESPVFKFTMSEDKRKQLEQKFMEELSSNKITLFWNPHTEDTFSVAVNSQISKLSKIRKTRKNKH